MPLIAPLVRRILHSGSRPAGVVLLYHRIADLEFDPQCLAVSPARFASHLDVIVRHGIPMPLRTMLCRARAGTLLPGSVAITFDDGYADNLTNAAPLLAKASVPATVFLSTGPIVDGREFWWDALERCLLTPEDVARHAAWNVTQRSCPTPRHREYLELCIRLKTVDAVTRESVLVGLFASAGLSATPRQTHRPLSREEVSILAAMPGITVGAHTVTHPSLAALSADEQLSEIACSRRTLEAMTGRSIVDFAYPFGGQDDVSQLTVDAARASGLSSACTTASGSINAGTDHLRVPRAVVRNWTAEEFSERLFSWTGATVS